MLKRALSLLLVLSLGCREGPKHAPATLEEKVVAALWEAVEQSGMPEIDDDRCHTQRFRIFVAQDAEDFRLRCYGLAVDKINGCFGWRILRHSLSGVYSIVYPVATVNPRFAMSRDVIVSLAVHELLHGYTNCAIHPPLPDIYDAGHRDHRVFKCKPEEGGCPDSLEARTRAILAPTLTGEETFGAPPTRR